VKGELSVTICMNSDIYFFGGGGGLGVGKRMNNIYRFLRYIKTLFYDLCSG